MGKCSPASSWIPFRLSRRSRRSFRPRSKGSSRGRWRRNGRSASRRSARWSTLSRRSWPNPSAPPTRMAGHRWRQPPRWSRLISAPRLPERPHGKPPHGRPPRWSLGRPRRTSLSRLRQHATPSHSLRAAETRCPRLGAARSPVGRRIPAAPSRWHRDRLRRRRLRPMFPPRSMSGPPRSRRRRTLRRRTRRRLSKRQAPPSRAPRIAWFPRRRVPPTGGLQRSFSGPRFSWSSLSVGCSRPVRRDQAPRPRIPWRPRFPRRPCLDRPTLRRARRSRPPVEPAPSASVVAGVPAATSVAPGGTEAPRGTAVTVRDKTGAPPPTARPKVPPTGTTTGKKPRDWGL